MLVPRRTMASSALSPPLALPEVPLSEAPESPRDHKVTKQRRYQPNVTQVLEEVGLVREQPGKHEGKDASPEVGGLGAAIPQVQQVVLGADAAKHHVGHHAHGHEQADGRLVEHAGLAEEYVADDAAAVGGKGDAHDVPHHVVHGGGEQRAGPHGAHDLDILRHFVRPGGCRAGDTKVIHERHDHAAEPQSAHFRRPQRCRVLQAAREAENGKLDAAPDHCDKGEDVEVHRLFQGVRAQAQAQRCANYVPQRDGECQRVPSGFRYEVRLVDGAHCDDVGPPETDGGVHLQRKRPSHDLQQQHIHELREGQDAANDAAQRAHVVEQCHQAEVAVGEVVLDQRVVLDTLVEVVVVRDQRHCAQQHQAAERRKH
ncbi:endopeptidase, NLPC/P60 domain containing protein [Babesia caballi]|uniref:Endopeptidase, NLPC/P60 domain containing protein n=1 Tax=Babesia caballi TaxID=5871 RepID=A0AAV4LWA6_BABCB|nr:endopeptidase, NLPC/P60 domain containing protein [Babesia caballi]